MPTVCVCGNVRDPEAPLGFRVVHTPCACTSPAPHADRHDGTVIVMRGNHPRDPKRAKLGLPDRTPFEKYVLKGSFHE